MKFTKMQGIGNDYVYVDCFQETVEDPGKTAVFVSDRHFGIGSDGLILIKPSTVADCQMDMYNLDGSRGAMCGNGVRCVGKYAYDHGIVPPERTTLTVETASGIKTLKVQAENGKARELTVDMGKPEMGNPHAVLFVDNTAAVPLETIGPKFENHSRFPDRTNTEFVEIVDRGHIKMRVWERGSGETMACGTGACASAVASILAGYTDTKVEVELLGGSLTIEWDREKDTVYMTGPAEEVFSGEIDLKF